MFRAVLDSLVWRNDALEGLSQWTDVSRTPNPTLNVKLLNHGTALEP